MMDWLNSLNIAGNGLVSSLIVIVGVLFLRALFIRQIRGAQEILNEEQRRWISRIKNASLFTIILGLVLIWAPKLNTFLLSITAFAATIVIATKEMILCISGSIVRISTRPFMVGDWIEIAGTRGEVVDTNLFSTVVQELGQKKSFYEFTGKTVTLPNSLFLSQNIKNENFLKKYTYHEFAITVEPTVNPMLLKNRLKTQLAYLLKEYQEAGVQFLQQEEKKIGADLPDTSPQVLIHTTDVGKHIYTIKIFCPTPTAIAAEQKVTDHFFQIHLELKEEAENDKKTKQEPGEQP